MGKLTYNLIVTLPLLTGFHFYKWQHLALTIRQTHKSQLAASVEMLIAALNVDSLGDCYPRIPVSRKKEAT